MTTLLAPPDPIADVVPFTAFIGLEGHVHLDGELDIGGLDALRAVLDQAFLAPGDVTIDAASLSFIDSRAIAELLHFQLLAAAQNRQLGLLRPSATLAKVIDILDLGHILVTVDA